ncbi:MAG TPA: alanine racemase, partial [Chlamydiales bacterium]|nr:alanine racemase [Chlamydiales bacterium]
MKIATSFAHPSWIEIDLEQFRKNLAVIRRRIGERLLCFPVKANAYGHGLVPMSLAAQEVGVDVLAVSCLKEGVELRGAGVQIPILVFGAIHEDQIDALIDHNLEFSISSHFKADLALAKIGGRRCRVHVEVDTGMHRTGVRPETALTLFRKLSERSAFEIAGVYSHLATADEPNNAFVQTQIDLFETLRQQIGRMRTGDSRPVVWHLANSGGVYFYPDSYFDMVRPGLLCYGLTPDGREEEEIRPIFSLKARISYFKVVAANQGVSYGHLYRTKKQTRIVTVPIGYGDGYPRALSNYASVKIRGKLYPIAGRICMDQFMVDIGDDEAYVGDEVTLIDGEKDSAISLWHLARLANVDPREIFCRFNDRIPRIY